MGDGVIVGGGVGSDLGCFRIEIEGFYSGNEIDQASLTTNAPTPIMLQMPEEEEEFLEIGSDVNYSALMVNILREIPIPCRCLTGYVGTGIGVASLEVDTDLNNVKFSDRDSTFAWQFIAGVEYEINCRLSAFTQYRVLAIEETYLASNGVSFDIDRLFNHSVNIGARLKLK